MAYIYQTPIWALPNYQFRYPELFQQQQELLEHERDRAAGEAYLNAYNKHVYGDDHTQCRHYRFPHPDQRPRSSGLGPAVEEQVMCESEFRRRQLFHEAVILDHLSELVWQTRLVRGELEKMNAVLSTPTADADGACACDTEPDVLAECDAPGWFHHSDGDEEEEDSLERFQCNSCGSDHPHFAAAFAVPPTTDEEKKKSKPEEGKGKGKEVKREQQKEEELVVPNWVDEVERKVGSESELETSSGLGSSA